MHWLSAARVAIISRRVPTTPARKGEAERLQDELGARVAAAAHGAVGRPDVLADLDGDRAEVEGVDAIAAEDALGVEREARRAAGEGAALVEDVVRGELLLRGEAEDPAAVDERAAVEEVAPDADREADGEDGAVPGRLPREALELAPLGGDEAAPLDQVLRGVAADDLLGEDGDGRALLGHGVGEAQAAVDVAADGPDRGVDAGDPDLHEAHRGEPTPSSRRPHPPGPPRASRADLTPPPPLSLAGSQSSPSLRRGGSQKEREDNVSEPPSPDAVLSRGTREGTARERGVGG